MQNRTFLNILFIVDLILAWYFYTFGFSRNIWTRYGQYFAFLFIIYSTIDEWFRPGGKN